MPADRPLLTFDLDGVLCRPPFGINPGKGMNKRRDKPGTRNLLWRTEGFRYALRRPMPHAREGFHTLCSCSTPGKQQNADLEPTPSVLSPQSSVLQSSSVLFSCHILTARAERARGFTERWFERHFGLVPTIHMRPHWSETSAQFKARMVQELQPVAHFEDDPHTAQWLAELIPQVFLVDWPRNRWLDREPLPNLHRIRAISDALPLLESR